MESAKGMYIRNTSNILSNWKDIRIMFGDYLNLSDRKWIIRN